MPDAEVAKRLGVCLLTVFKARKKRGIPSALEQDNLNFRWTDRHIALLGTKPDETIAQQLGISPCAVWRKRRKLGIPSHHERTTLKLMESTESMRCFDQFVGQLAGPLKGVPCLSANLRTRRYGPGIVESRKRHV